MGSKLYLPHNLKAEEQKIRTAMDSGLIEENGDFGTYYALRNGLPQGEEWIINHNMSEELGCSYLLNFTEILQTANSILDVGCGAGFVTNAIKKAYPNSRIVGLDIAEDAIEYAKTRFPECEFVCCAATELYNQKYDVIHAREFYPFTRMDDYNYMRETLVHLMSLMSDNGVIIVTCSAKQEMLSHCILSFTDRVKADFPAFDIRRVRLVKTRIAKYLGVNTFSQAIGRMVDFFLKTPGEALIIRFK